MKYPTITTLLLLFSLLPSAKSQVALSNAVASALDNELSLTLSAVSIPSGDDRLILVHWQGEGVPATVTFDGNEMTVHQINKFWYLTLDSGAAVAGDVVLTFNTPTVGIGAAIAFTGTSQTAPLGTVITAPVSNSENKTTISSEPDELVIDIISAFNGSAGCASPPTLSAGPGQSVAINSPYEAGPFCAAFGISSKTGSASVDMAWTAGNSGGGDHYVLNINKYKPSKNVGIGTTTPDQSAALEVKSSNQGLLMPSMTTAERDAIENPAQGLIIYNTIDSCFNYYAGDRWYKDCGRSLTADEKTLQPLGAGGIERDQGNSIITDASGNVYVLGSFEGTATFGQYTFVAPGDTNIVLIKYSPDGNIIWAERSYANNFVLGNGIATDPSGNIYIVGEFRDTIIFGDTLTSGDPDSASFFMVKFNKDGNIQWTKQGDKNHETTITDIAIDTDGFIYVTGAYKGSPYFNGTVLTTSDSIDIFLAKYAPNGSLIWIKEETGTSLEIGSSIAVDNIGNIFIAGRFEGTAIISDSTFTSIDSTDIFIAKYNNAGDFQWAKHGKGMRLSFSTGIATDIDGNTIFSGVYSDDLSLGDSTLTKSGFFNLFVAKYDADGNLLWTRKNEGTGAAIANSIAVDDANNIYITGLFVSQTIFGNDTISSTQVALFIVKYQPDGTVLWIEKAESTSSVIGNDITTHPSGVISLTGAFSGMATFGNKSLTSNGDEDLFMAQYSSNGNDTLFTSNISSSQDNDIDPTNELQDWNNLPGIPVDFTDGVDDVTDDDADPTNELIFSAGLVGNFLEITDAGGTKSVDLSVFPETDPEVGINIENYIPKWNGTSLVKSNNLYEATSGNLGIGTSSPGEKLEVDGAVKIGNTANPSPAAGTIRWNPVTEDFEGFTGTVWKSLTSGSSWKDETTLSENNKIITPGAQSGDFFGKSVAISGNHAVIGAPGEGTLNGAAYVFKKMGNTWVELARLTDSGSQPNEEFGSSVSISGDSIIIVGAYRDNMNGSNSGAAFIYAKPMSGWTDMTETGILSASDVATGDFFGISVAIEGDVAVVGARLDDFGAFTNSGSAYVFTKPGGGWSNMTQTAKLTASDAGNEDYFGHSVAISDDQILIGAYRDGYPSDVGSAYLFEKPGGGWSDMTESAKFTASSNNVGDQFGISVSISGNFAIVGANQEDETGTDAGAAYIFEKPPGGWATMTETAKLVSGDAEPGDQFGLSVSIKGNYAIVGAHQDDDSGSNSGSAYVFQRNGGVWAQEAKLVSSTASMDNFFGYSVNIGLEYIIVGAHRTGEFGTQSGSIYFYE
jgi:hypothetical protein